MLENNFQPIILSNLRKYSKIKCAIYFSVLFIVATLTFSVTGAVCFVISYAIGFVLFYLVLKFKFNIIQLLVKPIAAYKRSDNVTTNSQYIKKVCNICEDENCLRHLNGNRQEPWINLHVHKQLDQSIENFYNIIIKKFIIPWYCKLTREETLLVEVRFLLRYASSSLLNRVLKVNIGQLITNKLIPCALRHYTLCNEAKRLMEMKGISSLEKAALLGPLKYSLHPALASRKQELQYLKFVTEAIMPLLLPKKHMNSKLFKILIQDIFSGWVLLSLTDILADPSVINTLVILATGDKKMSKLPDLPNHQVEFLQNFIKKDSYKQMRLLNLEVSDMLKNPEYLYAFMQFMKSEGKIHLLQFCLDIDEFNKRMLQPEMNETEKGALFKCASELYNNYFSHDSASFIPFEREYIEQFSIILKYGPMNIAKLQTSTVIYESYDYVFTLLDQEWAPKFFDSQEFYNLVMPNMVAEPKKSLSNNSTSLPNKMEANKKMENNPSLIVKPLSKLKDAFKSQPIDGQFLDLNDMSSKTGSEGDLSDGVDMEMQYSDILANYTRLKNKDMSTWKVSIEDVVEKKATNKTGSLDWFLIIINKVDPHGMGDDSQWIVERTDTDIYVLKEKLVEFHGETTLGDYNIPSKRFKTPADVRKKKYEKFLQHIMLIPLLRCSNLLHMFLTADADFSVLAEQAKSDSSNFPDFSSLYQTVTHKLRKERGQHLDTFLQAFLISADVIYYQALNDDKKGKEGDCDEEATDVVNDVTFSYPEESAFEKRLSKSVFENNFNISNSESNFPSFPTKDVDETNWKFTPCLLFILSEVFQTHHCIISFVEAFCQNGETHINNHFNDFLNAILCKVLSPQRLGYLIKLGQDLIFEDILPSKLKIDRSKKVDVARSQLQNAFPFYVNALLGPNFLKGADTLFEFLQNPRLNKQFVYNLFDIVLLELFPEIENSFASTSNL